MNPKAKEEKEVFDFKHAIRRMPGESVQEVSLRAKRLALERLAKERLSEIISEFRLVFSKFESQLPEGEAARALESFVAEKLSDHRTLVLLLDEKTARKPGSKPDLLRRLHEAVR